MRDPTSAGAAGAGDGSPAAEAPPGPGPGTPTGPGGPWRLPHRALPDLGPLRRNRDFRLLYTGQLVSSFGNMITAVAIPYQAYALTHSSLAVGLFGVVQLVPLLAMAFVGGALADAFDRRRLVQVTELSLAGLSGVLLVDALLPHPRLWLLYVVAALAAALDALQRPSLEALLPRLVAREELTAAITLEEIRHNLGAVLGPALAGLLIAGVGLPSTYAVDIATFGVSLGALRLMRAVPPPPEAQRPSLRGVAEGLRYAGSRPDLLGTYLVDLAAMFFGMPNALFPALAAGFARARGGLPAASLLGLFYAAPAAGALGMALTSGWVRHVHRHGWAVILAAGAWGVAIVGLGLAPTPGLALVCLVAAGAADQESGLFRSVIWNKTIPDALRGRLAGIELISYSSGPLLGDVEAGTVATAFSPRVSILSGGILCVVAVGLVALALPAFRGYDDRLLPAADEVSVGGG